MMMTEDEEQEEKQTYIGLSTDRDNKRSFTNLGCGTVVYMLPSFYVCFLSLVVGNVEHYI